MAFHRDQPPSQFPVLFHLEDMDRFLPIDPFMDGLMSVGLHSYERQKARIRQAGYNIRMATARGPVCTAGFLGGITEFVPDLTDNPAAAHKLLAFVADAIVKWLKAQVEIVGDSIEGIFILDDVVGFLSRKSYLEFAHPYLKQIFTAFPEGWVKVYHNNANLRPFLEDLSTAGLDVLNRSHSMSLARLPADCRLQGQGIGKALLRDAMLHTLQAADIAGIRALAVHAKDEAARDFYRKFTRHCFPSATQYAADQNRSALG